MKAWLRFFRIVNLPTVPGDVFVGATALAANGESVSRPLVGISFPLFAACLASVFLYMFGLADNDIVGAKTDGSERPIASGEVSLLAARMARGICLFVVLVVGSLANLPPFWWVVSFLLAVAVVSYNRTKWCLLMGLCRGLNVLCGGAVFGASLTSGQEIAFPLLALGGCAFVWTAYIAAVTKYSEGEESDPEKKRLVGLLIGAIVYLQLGTLLVAYVLAPAVVTRNLLLAGAGLLVFLRLMKRFLPGVSAS